MADSTKFEKDDWKTILGELDEIVRELDHFSALILGDKKQLEGESYPGLIHFISWIKNEKKDSWQKIDNFVEQSKENLKLLEETLQLKQWHRRIERTIIGRLPRHTWQIGTNSMEIINEMPKVLTFYTSAIEKELQKINTEFNFSTEKFEPELKDVKHQIELLEKNIKTHTKTKKGLLSRKEKMVYVQAYRETYLEIIERAKQLTQKIFKLHSKTFEDISQRFKSTAEKYKKSPASDEEIKKSSKKIAELAETWEAKGFQAFEEAHSHVEQIEEIMKKRRKVYLEQLKSNLNRQADQYIQKIQSIRSLPSTIASLSEEELTIAIKKTKEAIHEVKDRIDVIDTDPHEQLISEPSVVLASKKLATLLFDKTYGNIREVILTLKDQIMFSETTLNLIDDIEKVRMASLNPDNLTDVVDILPSFSNFPNKRDLLLEEISIDIDKIKDQFKQKLEVINKNLGSTSQITLPEAKEEISLKKEDLTDLTTINTVQKSLKEKLVETAQELAEFERKFSEGLGFHVNPQLESKLTKYFRPSFNPTIKEEQKLITELETFAENLGEETGEAISKFADELGQFLVKSSALEVMKDTLKQIAGEAKEGKITLTEITEKLEKTIEEYVTNLQKVLTKYEEKITNILENEEKLNFIENMSLENFGPKHEELIDNISLTALAKLSEKEEPLRKCKKCGSPIVWQERGYNEMLGFDYLKVRCEKGHEETLIGLEESEEDEDEEETLELKCPQCGEKPLKIQTIDLFTADELIVINVCPKDHKIKFTLQQ
ncbi:MAG: hypothetical protein GF308_01535 [Candidatus Heimdallarchaeota archaeon]|nr:hypothetical protein [Candidatus Heimdallarchaeota archaeon]